jgi:hypothetical protein
VTRPMTSPVTTSKAAYCYRPRYSMALRACRMMGIAS